MPPRRRTQQIDDDLPERQPDSGRGVVGEFFYRLRATLRQFNHTSDETTENDDHTYQERHASYEKDKAALQKIISRVRADLNSWMSGMHDSYAKPTLKKRTDYCVALASQFNAMRINSKDPLYAFVNRADERLDALRQVINAAMEVARLYEQYSRTPEEYSRVEALFLIGQLQHALDNLDPSPPAAGDTS